MRAKLAEECGGERGTGRRCRSLRADEDIDNSCAIYPSPLSWQRKKNAYKNRSNRHTPAVAPPTSTQRRKRMGWVKGRNTHPRYYAAGPSNGTATDTTEPVVHLVRPSCTQRKPHQYHHPISLITPQPQPTCPFNHPSPPHPFHKKSKGKNVP